ncbi:MAG: efflux RND transporter periplasmic adaptor subunit [Pikeienuella sp.]
MTLKWTFLIVAAISGLSSAARAADPAPVSVVAMTSKAQPFIDRLILRGRTEADRRIDVMSEITGLVISTPLRKGAVVKAGDVLCQIADGDRAAELNEANARLNEAEQNYTASIQLSKKGFASETRANTMIAELEQARARVLRAELDIARLRIAAPFDGVLESDTAELGALLQNGSICATLIALDPIKLIAYAPERSVDSINVGAEAAARLVTGREIAGRISFVARAADRDTRTYLVEAEAANADLSIRDGMTAEIEVVLEERQAHFAPQTALTLNDEGALGVRTVDDGRARFIPVEVLKDEPGGVWIVGPPPQVDIIVTGQEFVTDGAALAVEHVEAERIQ